MAATRAQAKTAMQAYKLHFIDRWTGSIRSYVGFEAATDEEACDHDRIEQAHDNKDVAKIASVLKKRAPVGGDENHSEQASGHKDWRGADQVKWNK